LLLHGLRCPDPRSGQGLHHQQACRVYGQERVSGDIVDIANNACRRIAVGRWSGLSFVK